MKFKKGFLLGETVLKMIIAVICIGFLIYFLVSLYFSKVEGQEQKQVEAVLERMNEIILDINSVESEYQIPNPEGWHLIGFTSDKPASCSKKSCICICKNDISDVIAGTQLSVCQESGKCLVVENLKQFDEIEINSPKDGLTNILIKKENNEVLILEK